MVNEIETQILVRSTYKRSNGKNKSSRQKQHAYTPACNREELRRLIRNWLPFRRQLPWTNSGPPIGKSAGPGPICQPRLAVPVHQEVQAGRLGETIFFGSPFFVFLFVFCLPPEGSPNLTESHGRVPWLHLPMRNRVMDKSAMIGTCLDGENPNTRINHQLAV